MLDKKLKNRIYTIALIALLCYTMVHTVYIYFTNPESDTVYSDIVAIHYIDMGQADATLIQGENFNMLIDAGEYKGNVINYLNYVGVETLDYVIATHPHTDHIGNMSEVIKQFEVKNFIMPDAVHATASFEHMLKALDNSKDTNVIQAEAGYKFESGPLKFTLYGPISQEYENLNNYSVVVRLLAGNTSFLFAGDAEKEVERELLESGYDLSADVYKASHHGSSTSSTPAFVEAINPLLAIVSCGKDNSYGHPHKETLETFENYGVKVLRTDKNGTIIVYSDGEEISYGTER